MCFIDSVSSQLRGLVVIKYVHYVAVKIIRLELYMMEKFIIATRQLLCKEHGVYLIYYMVSISYITWCVVYRHGGVD